MEPSQSTETKGTRLSNGSPVIAGSGATEISTSAPSKGTGWVKKKVDNRIQCLINHAVATKHRALILLVGDRAKDQVVNLHTLVSRTNFQAKVNILWCMKAEPDFGSTSSKRQERKAQREVKGGLATESTKEAFQTFLAQTPIRFCQYKETHKILGQTFGMVILQDFESLTPNVLARTIETAQGGGMIIFMLRAMQSLKQLYALTMDVHAKYKTAALRDVVPRFNERFILSLTECSNALCVDDSLNVLAFTEAMQQMSERFSKQKDMRTSAEEQQIIRGELDHEAALRTLKERLQESKEVGPLVKLCQTKDQAKTVLSLMQVITEKSLTTTCSITAARGRGKSAALGLAISGAIKQEYSNIFCTAPSLENVQTFFEFVVRGLLELGYRDRADFEVMQSLTTDGVRGVIRINVFKSHRQTIQYISPEDIDKFGQAEIVVIDEAAAIPLAIVSRLLGPYLVFLSSTISGYEGTGRSLSLKLLSGIRERQGKGQDSRALRELVLTDPIRYGPNDPVENWLMGLLCLDTGTSSFKLLSLPHPEACELFYVNRDALFSFHPTAEALLQRIFSLLASAHYKNQPNDLQLLSDAPGHHLFILCSKALDSKAVPDIYCAVHVAEEGRVPTTSFQSHLASGSRPSGDLIPYTLSRYFQEASFSSLSGMRVIRIATHPEIQRSGYGSRAIALLRQYYSGAISPLSMDSPSASLLQANSHEENEKTALSKGNAKDLDTSSLSLSRNGDEEVSSARSHLLISLDERPYEVVDYLGVSFGITVNLYNFWFRSGFEILYIRQIPNELTNEHSCIMLCPIECQFHLFHREFRSRALSLLPMCYRHLPSELMLSIFHDYYIKHFSSMTQEEVPFEKTQETTKELTPALNINDLNSLFSPSDLKRLSLGASTFVEMSVILDLVPKVARLYFETRLHRFPDGSDGVILSPAQAGVLLGLGLQCLSLEELHSQSIFSMVTIQQLKTFFHKAISRIVQHFTQIQSLQLDSTPANTIGLEQSSMSSVDRNNSSANENEEEIRDIQGEVVGLRVEKHLKPKICTDSTLLRDASSLSGVRKSKSTRSDSSPLKRSSKKSRAH